MAEHSESRPRSGAALARTMSIHTVESGALRFAVVHASGERAPSAPASARLPDADAIMLMTSVQGEAALLVEDRRIALGLTSVCIVWPRSALDVEMPTGSSFCALSIPAELIDTATLRAEGRAERVLEMDSAAAEVLAEYLRAVAIKVGELESDTEAAYIRLAFEMANRAFGEMRGRATRADVLRSQIMQYIEAHLSDPDLGPGRIARAHFISLRYLHALFRNEGITVAGVIRRRRLERCYASLVDPSSDPRSIASIASDHGLIDAAQFSRLFRRHFGVTPSSLRAAAGGRPHALAS